MQANHKSIDALDEILRLWILERGRNYSFDNETIEQISEHFFKNEPQELPTPEKSAKLLEQLHQVLLESQTFGELLQAECERKSIETLTLLREAKLSKKTLNQLLRDELLPNRVPVMLMKRLLEVLDISYSRAKSALRQTVELIFAETTMNERSSARALLSYRQSFHKANKRFEKTSESLDQKTAVASLEAYLQRLEHLFTVE